VSLRHCVLGGNGLLRDQSRIAFVLQYAIAAGALYGVIVYFFMNRVVVPLSAAHKFPFSLKMMIIGVTIHIFCVGLPIAIVARRFSTRTH
jgi:hypothetical protein